MGGVWEHHFRYHVCCVVLCFVFVVHWFVVWVEMLRIGFVWGLLDLAGIRIWWEWGSTFWRKGTAETRLFGEGKVVKIRNVHLDRGWCNIQHRLGWGGVGCWVSNLLLKTKREIFRRGLWEDFGRSSNRVCLHSIIYTCIY